jgi:hypothetical protein
MITLIEANKMKLITVTFLYFKQEDGMATLQKDTN